MRNQFHKIGLIFITLFLVNLIIGCGGSNSNHKVDKNTPNTGSNNGENGNIKQEKDTTVGLAEEEILTVIRANLNQIRLCYEQLLDRSPSAAGKLSVDFVIGANGRVAKIEIAPGATITDSTMQRCVTEKIQRWDFPKPRGPISVDVKYPFVFDPL